MLTTHQALTLILTGKARPMTEADRMGFQGVEGDGYLVETENSILVIDLIERADGTCSVVMQEMFVESGGWTMAMIEAPAFEEMG